MTSFEDLYRDIRLCLLVPVRLSSRMCFPWDETMISYWASLNSSSTLLHFKSRWHSSCCWNPASPWMYENKKLEKMACTVLPMSCRLSAINSGWKHGPFPKPWAVKMITKLEPPEIKELNSLIHPISTATIQKTHKTGATFLAQPLRKPKKHPPPQFESRKKHSFHWILVV